MFTWIARDLNGRAQFSQLVFSTGGFANEKKKITADIPVSGHSIFYNNMKLIWTRPSIPTTFGIVIN